MIQWHKYCLLVNILLMFVVPIASAGETSKPSKRQLEHRSSRIRYLNMRQQRYQNVVDTNIFKLAALYLEDHEFEKAVSVLKTVAQKSPDEDSRWTAHYVIGDIYWIENNDSLTAAKEFEQVEGTLEPICYTNLMDIYGEIGQKTESKNFALQRLNQFELKAKKNKSRHTREQYLGKIAFAKVKIFLAHGEKDRAINACRNLIASVQNSSLKRKAKSTIQRLR